MCIWKVTSFWKSHMNSIFEEANNCYSRHENPIIYWKIYFDFGYYLLIIPFRFEYNNQQGHYKLHTNFLQKIASTLIRCIIILGFGPTIWKICTSNEINPSFYLEYATYLGEYICQGIMVVVFWNSSTRYQVNQIFQDIQQNRPVFLDKYDNGRKIKWITTFLCCFYILLCVLCYVDILEVQGWSLKSFYKFQEADIRNQYFFIFGKSLSIPSIVVILSYIFDFYGILTYLYGELIILLIILLFHTTIEEFCQTLKQAPSSTTMIFEHYDWIKQICNQINNVWGLALFGYFIGGFLFYSQCIPAIMSPIGFTRKFRYVIYLCIYFSAVLTASNANQKMNNFKQWLCSEINYSQISSTKVYIILYELQTNSISLSGNGCFNLTHSFLGTIISLTTTYAVITIQFGSKLKP